MKKCSCGEEKESNLDFGYLMHHNDDTTSLRCFSFDILHNRVHVSRGGVLFLILYYYACTVDELSTYIGVRDSTVA